MRKILTCVGGQEICLSASKGKTSDEDGDQATHFCLGKVHVCRLTQDGHHDGGATSGAPAANAAAIAKGKFIGKVVCLFVYMCRKSLMCIHADGYSRTLLRVLA